MSWWTTTVTCLLPPRITRQAWCPIRSTSRGAARPALLAVSLLLWACTVGAAPANPAGENLYRRGLRPSGEPVQAVREAGASIQGRDAAVTVDTRRIPALDA